MPDCSTTVRDTETRRSPNRRCPDCGGRVRRILRTENDRRRWDAERWRRYHCRHCAWQGLMRPHTHRHRSAAPAPALPLPLRIGRAAALMLLAVLVGAAALYMLRMLTGA